MIPDLVRGIPGIPRHLTIAPGYRPFGLNPGYVIGCLAGITLMAVAQIAAARMQTLLAVRAEIGAFPNPTHENVNIRQPRA